ncbi:hypothetical protein Bca52824_090729 [Brassica carinata]|uniref:Uncharacterized protein n=1 Tax=Brassica carinata TaxID=52824 RepID=A0A8X7THH0_BRACI|nr:hypothetical protein Bca52824_090729 [Brassica carinata]
MDVDSPVYGDLPTAEESESNQNCGGRTEPSPSKQGEILRSLATVEKDSQAIAESFVSLFLSDQLSEATSSSVDHMSCFGDAAGSSRNWYLKKQIQFFFNEFCFRCFPKGNRYINSCLRLNEEIKGVENVAARKHLRRNVDVLDTAVNNLLRPPDKSSAFTDFDHLLLLQILIRTDVFSHL